MRVSHASRIVYVRCYVAGFCGSAKTEKERVLEGLRQGLLPGRVRLMQMSLDFFEPGLACPCFDGLISVSDHYTALQACRTGE